MLLNPQIPRIPNIFPSLKTVPVQPWTARHRLLEVSDSGFYASHILLHTHQKSKSPEREGNVGKTQTAYVRRRELSPATFSLFGDH